MDTVQLRLDPGPTAPSTLGAFLLATLLLGGCGPDLETTDPPDTRDTTDPDPEVDAGGTDAADAPPLSPETDSTDVPPDTADGDAAAIDTTDGSGTDSSADADTSAPPVHVALRLGTRPIPAATVVFHDRDGHIVGREVTNANGEASHIVPDGAMVTYGFGGIGSEPVFRTVTGVQAGESLDLRIAADRIPSAVGAVRVDLPPEIAEADNYEVSIGCNTTLAMPGTDVVELDILDSCANGGDEFDVVARAFDGDEPVAYALTRDVRRATGRPTPVDLSTWKRDWVRKSVEVINAPERSAPIRARLGIEADGQHWRVAESAITLEERRGQAEFAMPADLADSVSYRTGIWEAQSGGQPHVMSIIRGEVTDTTSTPITVDLQSDLLPLLELASILQRIPERPTISWSAHGDLSAADVGVAVFTWTDAAGDKQQWHAYVPPARESRVRFPRLPDLYDSLAPSSPDSFQVGVAFIDRADVDGYTDLRTRGTLAPLDQLADGTRARITRLGFF